MLSISVIMLGIKEWENYFLKVDIDYLINFILKMLKVIAREVIRGAHVAKRLAVMYDRKTNYPANEPNEIVVHPHNNQFRMKANDVDSYQDAINVPVFRSLLDLQFREPLEVQGQLHCRC